MYKTSRATYICTMCGWISLQDARKHYIEGDLNQTPYTYTRSWEEARSGKTSENTCGVESRVCKSFKGKELKEQVTQKHNKTAHRITWNTSLLRFGAFNSH